MRIVALALSLVLTGCAAAVMPSPHTITAMDRRCTTGRAAPVLDTVVAAAGGIVAVAGLLVIARTAADDDVDHPAVPYTVGGMSAGVGVAAATLWGFSARHGFRSASACEQRR
jgi:hypothetical protein